MRRVVMVVCAALLLVPVFVKSRTSQGKPGRAAFSVVSGARISVKVSGAVRHPGIYVVAANSMADSVIKMAVPLRPLELPPNQRGAVSLANGSTLSLVRQQDGSQLLKAGSMTVPERMTLGVPLDITQMNEADFDRLPGIGPTLARRIIEYRQNNGGVLRVTDLRSVEGIGEKKYKMMKEYFQHP